MLIKMCKENSYAKMEKMGAQICRCTRQGLLKLCLDIIMTTNFKFIMAIIASGASVNSTVV